jgi:Tn3 transposase DDE domain
VPSQRRSCASPCRVDDAPRSGAAERVELAAIFDRPLDARVRLEQMQAEQGALVRRLQHGFDSGVDVLFDGQRIVGRRPEVQVVPASAVRSRDTTHGMLSKGSLPMVVIDVAGDTDFMLELGHGGSQQARSPDRNGQVVAALIAAATGMGYARMAAARRFTERQIREATERHLTIENVPAADALIREAIRRLGPVTGWSGPGEIGELLRREGLQRLIRRTAISDAPQGPRRDAKISDQPFSSWSVTAAMAVTINPSRTRNRPLKPRSRVPRTSGPSPRSCASKAPWSTVKSTRTSSNPSHRPVSGNQALKTLSFALNSTRSQHVGSLDRSRTQASSRESATWLSTPSGSVRWGSASIPTVRIVDAWATAAA